MNIKRNISAHFKIICYLSLLVFLTNCKSKETQGKGGFASDVAFMQDYVDVIQLSDPSGNGKVAVSAALQGRVMTSSSSGDEGQSYGWINKELFKSKDTLDHINVFGGEERFWIGPEGGQYSLFFTKGVDFNLDNWYTPKLLDLDHFDVKEVNKTSATFTKNASLTNYSGFKFDIGIERKIEVLSSDATFKALGIEPISGLNSVAYQSTNTLTNTGNADWKKETGLLSIWLLGMFNPSPETTIMIPYVKGDSITLGKIVNDYFGKVPAERLIVNEGIIYFKGDGKFRSKIGLSPKRATDILGSYDAKNHVLTVVNHSQEAGVTDYVNSKWELQDKPFSGDVINAYNDGPPEPGKKPLGPFYEMESSSPALALKVGESGLHTQLTCHFEGDPAKLDQIARKLFGISLEDLDKIFKK
ncbi:hypothetical protein ADIARSV_4037 [Arcticibacter svalbardensis MN12-7]|uniref:Uncharacterized protein n=1 Tax=Arcticibacter svalbardensis MN12-7 TaxID=1150600 RepID=R9GMK5_9SPHI|nr:DUF6786 family protein [Arcticibacter svalbardensis]EOR92755.1 hypothetical protein ADIARSV_4037 [Arcticibacter svalbardensis MN12-7]